MGIEQLLNSKTVLERLRKSNQLRNTSKVAEGSFLDNVKKVCAKNGFGLFDYTSCNPDVIFIGDYHPKGIEWFADNIERILVECVKPGNVILMEGEEGKVIYPLFKISQSPINDITQYLDKLGVVSIFNDSYKLLQQLKKLRDVLPTNYLQMSEENKKAVEETQRINDNRDYNFVYGDFGITKFPEKKYQIAGLMHLVAGKITPYLQEEGISYAVFVPTDNELPDDEKVNQHIRATKMLNEGPRNDKIKAIKILKEIPIRNSFIQLYKALDDRSGKVRKYAAYALGNMKNPKSIEYLIQKTNDEDKLARWTVGRALSRFKDKKVEELASNYLSTEDREKWTTAALLLHETNFSSNNPKINQGLNSDDPFIRALAINLIDKTNDVDVQRILSYFDDKHPAVREEAIRLVSRINPELVKLHEWSNEHDKYILNFIKSLDDNLKLDLKSQSNKDKIKGSLYGAIIGDAMGAPIEGLPLYKINEKYGKVIGYINNDSRRVEMPAGSYTDDGELTLKILSSIESNGFIDPYDISKRFGVIGKKVDDDFDRNIGYGYLTLMAFRKLYAGVNWRLSGNDSTGCGAAMRVAPIATHSQNLKQDIIAQSQITHTNSLAIGGALAIGYAIQRAYNLPSEFDRKELIQDIISYIRPVSQELATELRYLINLIGQEPSQVLAQLPITRPEPRRKGKGTLGTVPCALYCFLRTPHDFEKTLTTSINHSGDSDSIGAMACAISGAYNGFNKIPKRFVAGLYKRKEIDDRIQRYLSSIKQ